MKNEFSSMKPKIENMVREYDSFSLTTKVLCVECGWEMSTRSGPTDALHLFIDHKCRMIAQRVSNFY